MLIDGLPLDAPAAPLSDLLRVGLDAGPQEPALVSATRSMSWAELEEESERLAGGYRELGLEAGDRIASLMPNRIALIVHYLACFKAGLVVTPLNYRYTHREIDHALQVSGARALLAHVERFEDVGASELAGALPLGIVAYADPEGPGRSADVDWPHDFDRLLEHEPLPLAHRLQGPEEILFLDEMPLNPTGKIDRVGLKRMAEDHLHPHGL